jgi:TPR repeat protein
MRRNPKKKGRKVEASPPQTEPVSLPAGPAPSVVPPVGRLLIVLAIGFSFWYFPVVLLRVFGKSVMWGVCENLGRLSAQGECTCYHWAAIKYADPIAQYYLADLIFDHQYDQNNQTRYTDTACQKNPKLACELLKMSSKLEFPPAQASLAATIKFGACQGDVEESYRLYKAAAKAGYAEAQFRLGVMLVSGTEIEPDLKKGHFWAKKAADQGHVDAMYQMGLMTALGKGCDKDDAESLNWFESAAKTGHMHAQLEAARMYLHGIGCSPDRAKAISGFGHAAEAGSEAAKTELPHLRE